MRPDQQPKLPFLVGFLSSFLMHLLFAVLTIIILESSAARASKAPEIFSVTLEGGEKLGGFSQAPKPGSKKILTPTPEQEAPKEQAKDAAENAAPPKEEPPKEEPPTKEEPKVQIPEKVEEKKLTEPSVVEDPAKVLAMKKAAEEKERKQQELEDQKKKAEVEKKQKEAKQKDEADRAKKAEEQKLEDQKRREKERSDRDKKLADTLKRLRNQYEGESADAGGKGFGAAKLGGKGMGGGTLTSLEKLAYSNALKTHVKSGWRWMGGSEVLKAQVRVKLLPTGQIEDVRIEQGSGNSTFDDSVVRAVYKASPVPPPPADLYEEFKDTRFTFDSSE